MESKEINKELESNSEEKNYKLPDYIRRAQLKYRQTHRNKITEINKRFYEKHIKDNPEGKQRIKEAQLKCLQKKRENPEEYEKFKEKKRLYMQRYRKEKQKKNEISESSDNSN